MSGFKQSLEEILSSCSLVFFALLDTLGTENQRIRLNNFKSR